MTRRTIKAQFYGGCTVIITDRIVISQVGFDTAEKHIAENGGRETILQEFIDDDGWQGFYIYPADLSDDI